MNTIQIQPHRIIFARKCCKENCDWNAPFFIISFLRIENTTKHPNSRSGKTIRRGSAATNVSRVRYVARIFMPLLVKNTTEAVCKWLKRRHYIYLRLIRSIWWLLLSPVCGSCLMNIRPTKVFGIQSRTYLLIVNKSTEFSEIVQEFHYKAENTRRTRPTGL